MDTETAPGLHQVRDSWVRDADRYNHQHAARPTSTDRPAAGQLPSAVTRRQTNGILCLIDDDYDQAEGGKSGIGGWDQSSAVMSLIDM